MSETLPCYVISIPGTQQGRDLVYWATQITQMQHLLKKKLRSSVNVHASRVRWKLKGCEFFGGFLDLKKFWFPLDHAVGNYNVILPTARLLQLLLCLRCILQIGKCKQACAVHC